MPKLYRIKMKKLTELLDHIISQFEFVALNQLRQCKNRPYLHEEKEILA